MNGDDSFDEAIHRVMQEDYTPNVEDILWYYIKTTGIYEMKLNNKLASNSSKDLQEVKIVDVGGRRSERKKWIKTFYDVTTLFFFVDISGYDESLAEDEGGNKMQESFALFGSLAKSRWFQFVPIKLVFHQMDKLQWKLEHGRYPDVFGDDVKEDLHTVQGVKDYYTREFLGLNTVFMERAVSVHYTSIYELEELGNIFLHNAC
jgi:G-protein alpha subunit